MSLNKKSVLITGCSSGIGYATAKFLHQQGYQVISSARKQEDVNRLTSEGFESVLLDLANSQSIQEAVKQILQLTNGQLYAVFHNGAFGQPGAVEDLTRDVLRAQFETNLFGVHELTNLLIPIMRKQGYGKIIYNSSVLGFIALKYRGAYNASKFALEGLVDTLRLELQGTNIHLSLIEPGPIQSDFRQNSFLLYKKNINPAISFHRENYLAMENRLQKKGHAMPFTLPAQAVADQVLQILKSEYPKPRYYITVPTFIFGFLKRILPTRWLDFILDKV